MVGWIFEMIFARSKRGKNSAFWTFTTLMPVCVLLLWVSWKGAHRAWLTVDEPVNERQPIRLITETGWRKLEWREALNPSTDASRLMETRGLPWFDPRLPPSYEPPDFPYERSGIGDSWFHYSPSDPGSVLPATKFKWKRGLSISASDTRPMIAWHGTLHSHSGWSDGAGTPSDAYAFGRDIGGLDFLAVTDHPEYWLFNPGRTWEQLREIAEISNTPDFLALPGFEYSNPVYGHYIVIGSGSVCSAVKCPELTDFYSWLTRPENDGALIAFAHPLVQKDNATRYEFNQMSFYPALQSKMFGMEVIHWSGHDRFQFGFSGKQPFIDEALAKGWRPGALGSQDNHGINWGLPNSRVGVLMDTLTRENLMDALRARRFYATSSRDLQLSFDVRVPGSEWIPMGGEVQVKGLKPANQGAAGKFETRLRLFEPDEFNVPRRIEWILDGRVAGRLDFESLPHELAGSVANENYYAGEITGNVPLGEILDGNNHYLYARIFIGPDFNALAQTSPVIITP